MKKIILALVVFSIAVVACGPAFAASKKASERERARIEAEKAVKDLARKQAGQKATDLLNSKEWVIYLSPTGNSAGKRLPVITDVLTFKEGRVSSKHLTAGGFGESYYTLTVYDSGTAVWETMQRTDKEDLAFWRGELRGDSLTGVMNIQTAKGVREEYSFGMNAPAPALPQPKKR
jgi:type II secretory pathway pseudopilin PulG